ncbi:MAG: hypothetical protein ACI4IL_06215 [Eubacterium sp.]
MKKSIKKIVASLLAIIMVLGTCSSAFAYTVTDGIITDLDDGESIYLLAGNATGWNVANPDAVLTPVEGKDGVLSFNVELAAGTANEWEKRFSIVGNYRNGETYVQGGWTRILLGEPEYLPNDTFTCLSVICVDDLEAATSATVYYDTRTSTLAIVDRENNEIPYTLLWASMDRDEAKADGSAYTLEELAEIGFDNYVASLSADRRADINAIDEEITLTKSVFNGKYLSNVAGLINYIATGEDYLSGPAFTIDAPDTVCRTQDCEASVTLPDSISDAVLTCEFIGRGGAVDTTIENGMLNGTIKSSSYPNDENSFKLIVYATTDDGFSYNVSKTVKIQNEHAGGVATCTESAICDTCGEHYGELDSSNHNLEKISANNATVTETGNTEYWHCTDCGKYFTDENGTDEITLDDTIISKLPPEIIEGKGQSVTEGESKELTFKSNAAFSDFIRVELDGKTLDAENYTATEGSTIVTLKADYVATLSAGEHTIGIVSESGTATTTFTVNAKSIVNNDTKSPETGNDEYALYFAMLFALCGAGIITASAYSKRKKHS